jgi:hypothetical protein
MSDIFLGYSRKNEAAVTALAEDIRSLGHIVWFDKDVSGDQEALASGPARAAAARLAALALISRWVM